MEFVPELEKLANKIGDIPILMNIAMDHGLDLNWLMHGNIPDDIILIHKNLREYGYLKA